MIKGKVSKKDVITAHEKMHDAMLLFRDKLPTFPQPYRAMLSRELIKWEAAFFKELGLE